MKVRKARIGEILELQRQPVEVDLAATYTPIGVRGFGRGLFQYDPVLGADLGKLRFFELERDRLVVSNIKGWEGAVAVTPNDESGRIASNRFLTYATRDHNVDLRFVASWLLSEEGIARLGAASPGSADRNRTLSIKNFEAIEVPLPPIVEQCRIATHLERVESASRARSEVDAKSARRVADLVEGAVASAAKAPRRAAADLLEIDRPWFDHEDGASYLPVGVRGFGRGMIRYPATTREGLSKLRYFHLVPDRLLVSNIKAWEGAVTTTKAEDSSRIASNRFLQYRLLGTDVLLEWVRLFLVSGEGLHQLQEASPGSADRNRTLSLATFSRIQIPVPTPEVQEQVARVARVHSSLTSIRSRRDVLGSALLPAARNEVFSSLR
ncbi:hypothetical protein N802_08920 [Knoellia sinensis KCTC 19936]|uniref:Type I restriction modification DNA specificity domain-containing protein n=1 Tax=Knoellia sinensis KCTC 19936 TaxID=1385520 RepID=A0A0A0JEG5_9MICO|nr:restriction endonuclease subunit S [Knoellia sinensis]KGN33986.1 hypothetical protein N802_08920 [Knoellia sinensis KCTC 19936]